MFFFNKHFYYIIIISTILTGCQLQDPDKLHGIVFLKNRADKLELNTTNKNDVIRILGYPHIKDVEEPNSWIYLERVLSKGKFHKLGQHNLKVNDVLVLSFDKYGILNFKEIITKKEINEIKFTENKTESQLTKKSFVQSFLQSVKQKMYSNRRGTEF